LDLGEMSLINKMLQDLDARGSTGPGSLDMFVRPAVHSGMARWRVAMIATVAVAVVAAAGFFGWQYSKRLAGQPKPATIAGAAHAPVARSPFEPAPAAATPEKPVAPAAVPGKSVATVPAPVAVQASAPVASPPATAKQARAVLANADVPPSDVADAGAGKAAAKAHPKPPAQPAAGSMHDGAVADKSENVAEARSSTPAKQKSRKSKSDGKSDSPGKPATVATDEIQTTPQQRAESAYRKALAALPEGRVNEAITELTQAVQIDPYHDAARQTLVGLLIEAHRTDDAIRHLQLGLTLQPRQPAMAMLMARLQIERGGSGLDILMRTLPYATGNSEYHAFLAGVLQREQRHAEAAEQFQAALRNAPQNGVWWMGLGISLQTEKRAPEALAAFRKAKGAGLSAELNAFVERKIGQLAN
jgi:MSHA biogenesis protein MshN